MLAEPISPTSIDSEALMFRAALLAGLGTQAQSIAARSIENSTDSSDRTCIEGGSPLLISLQAPGDRSLRVWTQRSANGHSSRWLGTEYALNRACRCWKVETFFPDRPTAWQHTIAFAQAANQAATLREIHAVLGLRGRLFQTTRSIDSAAEAWVTWQLERGCSPAEAIAPFTSAWSAIAPLVRRLFGRAIGSRSSPWSVACNLANPTSLRIGTTIWARLPEDEAKHQRLAATVAELGGDDRFAQALYKLLASARSNAATRIGRAIEIEVAGDSVTAMHGYLSVPTRF